MSNSYFQFKQFNINQDKCAMKVCTDACVFGAFMAKFWKNEKDKTILDIGTGTGLLSMMLAQKLDGKIDAIEINEDAYIQASENFSASPFANKVTAIHKNIILFKPDNKYDFIISNPPFYHNDLATQTQSKNEAMHNASLTFTSLINAIEIHLKPTGQFAVLLPYKRVNEFIEAITEKGFHLNHKLLIKQTPQHPYFRGILICSKTSTTPIMDELIIKGNDNEYTLEFVNVLTDYYLYL
jgi:tRNA1Val (adenine37-N6)-methyltransferase